MKPLSIEDKNIFDEYFCAYPPEISEYTFTNLFMWNHVYDIKYEIIDGCLLIASGNNVFPPVGPSENTLNALEKFCEMLKKDYSEINLTRFDNDSATKIRENFNVEMEPDEDNFDYVYNTQDLINLSGRKYHNKKNHINKFMRTYDYVLEELRSENALECLNFTEKWISLKDIEENPGIVKEFDAIKKVLENYDFFNVKGIVLKINGKIEAYSFGEKLNPETAVTHIEKANPEIKDAYAFINMCFAKLMSEYKYINREQDLGIPGLRYAKKSYHPAKMILKFKGKLQI